MDEIKIDPQALYEAGEYIGFVFAPLIRGFIDGMEAFEIAEVAQSIEEVAEDTKKPAQKTQVEDCRKCWCDQCNLLEQCTYIRDGETPNGIHPHPCTGCENGMRFKPCEMDKCNDFVQGDGLNNG